MQGVSHCNQQESQQAIVVQHPGEELSGDLTSEA